MGIVFQHINNGNGAAKLERRLEELIKTEAGKVWITSRYGTFKNPGEIIDVLKASTWSLLVMQGEDVAGFGDISYDAKKHTYQLGYLVFPEFTKQGLGYLLAETLLKYAFRNKLRLKAECEITNTPSKHLLQRLAKTYKPSNIEINENYSPHTQVFTWEPQVT